MSMRSSFVYGFGFEVYDVKPLALIGFIENHKETLIKSDLEREMVETINNTENGLFAYNIAEEYFEDWEYACDVTGQEGFGAVISNVISRETGIRIEYQMGQSDCGSYPSVLLAETYPWLYNEKERNLTVDSLTEILLPYAEELGLSKDDIDALEIEYYG